MKTYEVTQMVEVLFTHKIRAKNAEEANSIAIERTRRQVQRINNLAQGVKCGFDIHDDYIPATDEPQGPSPFGRKTDVEG